MVVSSCERRHANFTKIIIQWTMLNLPFRSARVTILFEIASKQYHWSPCLEGKRKVITICQLTWVKQLLKADTPSPRYSRVTPLAESVRNIWITSSANSFSLHKPALTCQAGKRVCRVISRTTCSVESLRTSPARCKGKPKYRPRMPFFWYIALAPLRVPSGWYGWPVRILHTMIS